ncbi:hypothetical protein A4D02_27790 [Niastella koreensis]|uniref:Uncharacterized protein n=2 Tax=Niastella koreensis TaxID=354356 RepID=G8TI30_NIAKG|nr:hypothetical protein [Niastella koreensis]AEV99633.1 hypothetical protein Niako_3318 [Niastella koreensis GR20-10]OQP49882.1 hypothetical protein A4D02_27790 [Niastella koreensis]
MESYYQHLDMQCLLDLLAEETEKYTKAFAQGDSTETAYYRIKVNNIIAEINYRKGASISEIKGETPLDSPSDTAPSTL